MKAGRATVHNIRDLTHNVREVEMRVTEPIDFTFQAGQFISVSVVDKVLRPYSLDISPQESLDNGHLLRICVKLVEGGVGSAFLGGLQAGDEVKFRGPMGRFGTDPNGPHQNLYFLATGTGISPLRSIICHLFDLGTAKQVTLLHGVRSQEDIFYDDLFQALADKHRNFTYVTTLSQPHGEWHGTVGRCTRHLDRFIRGPENTEVYMCGNNAMIEEVVQKLYDLGFPKEQIHNEKFG